MENNDITIRLAKEGELKDIQDLNLMLFEKEHDEFDDTLDLKWSFGEHGTKYFQERVNGDGGCVFVAIKDDKVIGYLAGGLHKDTVSCRILPKFAELENMLVLKEYRRMGIGTKLYSAFIEWCKSNGVGRLRVIASANNIDTISFYRKNGFKDYDLVLESVIIDK